MKRIVLMALLALALPLAAFASSIDFTNSGGSLTGSSAGLTLSGSTLTVYTVNGGTPVTGNLGTLTFSTGAFSGSFQTGGTFAGGGSFVIAGNGTGGIPNGVIFTGSFDASGGTWTELTLKNGTHNYTLTGTITGTWYNGTTVYGATTQLTINTAKEFNGHTPIKIGISSGDTNINVIHVVPEPGTLGLLGTGLVGIAGMFRRKLFGA